MIHRVVSVAALAVAFLLLSYGERLKTVATGTFDGDPFSLYAVVLVLSSLVLARGTARVYAFTFALILVVSTRNLVLAAFAMASVAFALDGWRATGAVVLVAALPVLGHADLARLDDPTPVGTAAFVLGLLATWLAIHRAVFARASYAPEESVHISYSALVALVAVATRWAAWLPEEPVLEALLAAAALVFASTGALGVYLAQDRRNLARWGLLAQCGLLCLFVLGGVHARPALLAQLLVSGFAVHAVARARDRLLLIVGALAFVSPPPLPGFTVKLVAVNAVLAAGHVPILFALLPAAVLLGAGAVRYAWKEPGETILPERWASPAGLAVAFAALVGLGLWAEPLVALVSLAASGLF